MAGRMGHRALATLEACGSRLPMISLAFSGCPEVPDQSGLGLGSPIKFSCPHSTSPAGPQPHPAAGRPHEAPGEDTVLCLATIELCPLFCDFGSFLTSGLPCNLTDEMTSEIPCDSNIVRPVDKTGWGREAGVERWG